MLLVSQKHHSEKGGFEPPDPVLAGQLLSREPDSASLAPLHLLTKLACILNEFGNLDK